METLHNCEPHFVRCLVPNAHKKPGEVGPALITHHDHGQHPLGGAAPHHVPADLQRSAGRDQNLHARLPEQDALPGLQTPLPDPGPD